MTILFPHCACVMPLPVLLPMTPLISLETLDSLPTHLTFPEGKDSLPAVSQVVSAFSPALLLPRRVGGYRTTCQHSYALVAARVPVSVQAAISVLPSLGRTHHFSVKSTFGLRRSYVSGASRLQIESAISETSAWMSDALAKDSQSMGSRQLSDDFEQKEDAISLTEEETEFDPEVPMCIAKDCN
jgi:hypothetical protein